VAAACLLVLYVIKNAKGVNSVAQQAIFLAYRDEADQRRIVEILVQRPAESFCYDSSSSGAAHGDTF
jgi:ribulose bisphosphate carboxylase small subunit